MGAGESRQTADSGTQQGDTGSSGPSQAESATVALPLCPVPLGGASQGLEPHGRESRAREPPRTWRPGGQTYLRSAEWAAMRFLRLLSARGQPERLKEKRSG